MVRLVRLVKISTGPALGPAERRQHLQRAQVESAVRVEDLAGAEGEFLAAYDAS